MPLQTPVLSSLVPSGTSLTAYFAKVPYAAKYYLYQKTPQSSVRWESPASFNATQSITTSGLATGTSYTMAATAAYPIDSAPQGGSVNSMASAVYYQGKIYYYGGVIDSGGTTKTNVLDIYDIATNSWTTGAAGPIARSSHSAVVFGDYMYVWGGTVNDGTIVDPQELTLNIYSFLNNSWSSINSWSSGNPSARSHYTAIEFNGKIYCWGGRLVSTGAATNTLDIYDIATNSWTSSTGGTARYTYAAAQVGGVIYYWSGYNAGGTIVTTMDAYTIGGTWAATYAGSGKARAFGIAGVYNDKIYFSQGYASSLADHLAVDIYSPSGNTWTSGGSARTRRYYPSRAVTVDNKIYVRGGLVQHYPHTETAHVANDIDIYDCTLGTNGDWLVMPGSRYGHTATLYDNKIYYIGGCDQSTEATCVSSLDVLDLATGTWTRKTGLAIKFHTAALDSSNGRIYVIGGLTSTHTVDNTLRYYNIATDTWVTVSATLPGTFSARYAHAAVIKDGIMYVWAGQHSSTFNAMFTYNIGTNTWSQKALGDATKRWGLCAFTVPSDNNVYFYGGKTDDSTPTGNLFIYNIPGDSWSVGSSGPAKSFCSTHLLTTTSASPWTYYVFFWGGSTGSLTETNQFSIYSPQQSAWISPSNFGISDIGSGVARWGAAAVSTGSNTASGGTIASGAQMITWGGANGYATSGYPTTIHRITDTFDLRYNSWSSNIESSESGTMTATTVPSTPNGATIAAINGSITASQIGVTWSSVAGATGYYVYDTYNSITTKKATVTTTSATITGLAPNTTRIITISAYNAAGESSQSSGKSLMTLCSAPVSPLVTSATTNSLIFTFSTPAGEADPTGTPSHKVFVNGVEWPSGQVTITKL